MEKSGIIRRIDELGRVVIPKEIRKSLRVKDFDPLEISIENNKITLTKYSPLCEYMDIAKNISKSVYELLDKNCIVTDREFAVSNGKKDVGIDKSPLKKEAVEVILGRIPKTFSGDKEKFILTEGGVEYSNAYVLPVLVRGDVLGAIVLVSNDEINKGDVTVVDFAGKVLSKYFE